MCEGWPVKQTGTKLSVVVNGELYAFDPSNYVDSGRIRYMIKERMNGKLLLEKSLYMILLNRSLHQRLFEENVSKTKMRVYEL